jgi:tetratricopeptide (TPR) repeat protein
MELFDQFRLFGGTYLIILFGVLLATGLARRAAQGLQHSISGEGSVPASSGLTGGAVVQRLLAAVGLVNVRLVRGGKLNCYHPWRKEIRLRDSTHDSPSLWSTAVAAHEVGHAHQFASDYFACRLRRAFWPACLIFITLCLVLPTLSLTALVSLPNMGLWLTAIGFLCVLMQLIVKLSLEKDASRRARELVQKAGLVNAGELPAFDRLLNAGYRTHFVGEAQRWLVLLVAGAVMVWGMPSNVEKMDADELAHAAAAALSPPVPAPPLAPVPDDLGVEVEPQQAEVIDLFVPLLSLGATAVPIVLLVVGAKFIQGEGQRKPSAHQRAVQRNNAGQLLYERGQLEEAVGEYSAALGIDRKLIAAHYNRGACHLRLGKLDEAIADLDTAIRLGPGFVDARALRGVVLGLKGDVDRALADLNHALDLAPRHVGALTARGNIWLARGNPDAALADYTASLEQAPTQADALRDRGLCWLQKGVLYRAAADLDESLRLNPTDAVAFNNRGVVFMKAGDYQHAVTDLNEAIRLMPEFPNPHKHLAWLWATCPEAEFRNGAASVVSATRALELNGWKSTEWLGVLAAAHAEAGEWEKAIEWQTKCLDAAPAEAQAAMCDRLAMYQAGQSFREQPAQRGL